MHNIELCLNSIFPFHTNFFWEFSPSIFWVYIPALIPRPIEVYFKVMDKKNF